MTNKELKLKSVFLRKNLLKYIYKAKAGHTGGSLSCVDTLNVLYNRVLNVNPMILKIQIVIDTFKAKGIVLKHFL